MMKIVNIVLLCLCFCSSSFAEEILTFSNNDYKTRYYNLLQELRCLVCQNQNLADSDAGLAGDLKKEVFIMIEAGKSDIEIKSFLTLRYGDFVLYKPPFNLRTVFLWLGPFVLLLFAFYFLFLHIKKKQQNSLTGKALNDKEKEILSRLLSKHDQS